MLAIYKTMQAKMEIDDNCFIYFRVSIIIVNLLVLICGGIKFIFSKINNMLNVSKFKIKNK